MQPEVVTKQQPETESPGNQSSDSKGISASGRPQANGKANAAQNGTVNGTFPPPKTDKPRPHVCGTCGRSFARLEHLKRHERSHTKEKPFECPECTRCFARRDLLLRHQQKLHMTNTTSSRPRTGRRESVGGASGGRVRKNSIASAGLGGPVGPAGPQPTSRRNTIAHIDLSPLGLMDNGNSMNRMNALGISLGHPMGMAGAGGSLNFDYRGMSNAVGHLGHLNGLPKLDLSNVNNMDQSNSLRTAPPFGSFALQTGFDLDQLFSPGTTVNPAQLHFGGAAPQTAVSQYPNFEAFTSQHPMIPEADDFGWMRSWNIAIPNGQENNENAIDESSPSRMSSSDSPNEYNESLAGSQVAISVPNGHMPWSQQEPQAQQSMPSGGPFQLDALGTGLPNMGQSHATVSPNHLHDQTANTDGFFENSVMHQHNVHQSDPVQQQQQHASIEMMRQGQMQSQHSNFIAPSLSSFSSDSPNMSSSSMNGSARQSSVTSISTDSITDATRQALLASLTQPSVFGATYRKFSQPSISSPLSPGAARNPLQGPNLPTTADLRRYVDAFMQFALPHMPVAHLPTLSFEGLDLSWTMRPGPVRLDEKSITGGAGCLILAMAAIGALYEYDHPASKDLFEAAKKMIGIYLEERRKVDMSTAMNGSQDVQAHQTPLWLVQAMLLNVIYGHQCGDKISADIASNHCAALVSLARAADLARPPNGPSPPTGNGSRNDRASADVEMTDTNDNPVNGHHKSLHNITDLQAQWLQWKEGEERKRTLFAIFIISSLLTTAYNQAPTIMNSEILLDLPCDEELWTAETAQEWQSKGGLAAAEANSMPFADALSTLLTAKQRQCKHQLSRSHNVNNPLGALQAGDGTADAGLRPSTFSCLVLINALHNYIWETRSRHQGREWTTQETESMFSHIEPALNAWQAAWKATEHHKLERPNPFGFGPLSADSIPLLDLAFLRLFVNLGRAKEAFWKRDFDGMAEELARGSEIVQHAESGPTNGEVANGAPQGSPNGLRRRASQASPPDQASSRRERHLRKAAFYAADSLTIASSYNLTYADMAAHELPIQSAMCFFDCTQVLGEWACTVQERVGRYLGVLGRDNIDFTQVPAIMLLETEDVELLRKIEQICESLEAKRFQQENLLAMDLQNINPGMQMTNGMAHGVNLHACGYGSKLLRVVALMLEKAVIWPVTHVMAKALETQATHMDRRAEISRTH
ncbi:hypothetical protein EJ03DRAFT_265846 [Teratosphaeria nubilosa]|uniref:C2H2-type domain-containing protein n=1 Tax=Teratosphaeria nubilosa TaxID=161662 RepID=A0A6G1LKP9_9PEZI|nr:hypothetical protein EJ03DRAFT_265846 [Teratosphaeria nubilosa]